MANCKGSHEERMVVNWAKLISAIAVLVSALTLALREIHSLIGCVIK